MKMPSKIKIPVKYYARPNGTVYKMTIEVTDNEYSRYVIENDVKISYEICGHSGEHIVYFWLGELDHCIAFCNDIMTDADSLIEMVIKNNRVMNMKSDK